MSRFCVALVGTREMRIATGVVLAATAWIQSMPAARAVGLTYVDADPLNFVNVSPASSVIFTNSNTDNFWGRRTSFGAADTSGTQAIYESGITEDSPLLTQTVSGLTVGASYDMYVVYWSNPNSPQDWRIQAGVLPDQLKTFNRLGPTTNLAGATAGNSASAGVWDVPPMNAGTPIFTATNLRMYLGKAGTAVADGSGQAQVYIDDIPNQGANFRTWFDGVAYVPTSTPVFVTATIDRNSGLISLQNQTTQNFTVKSYSVTSASGSLDATQWTSVTGHTDSAGDGSFDSHPWAISAPASPATTPFATALTEAATTGAGGLLAAGGASLALGNAWTPTPFQDVTINLTLSDNSLISITPAYTGDAIQPGDLDGNGMLDFGDYQTLMANLYTDVSALTSVERYTRGDVTRNGVIDYFDFSKFALNYDAEFGAGAFAAMTASVPEGDAFVLLALGGLTLVVARSVSRRHKFQSLPCAAKQGRRFGMLAAGGLCVWGAAAAVAAPVTDWMLDPTFGGGLNGSTIFTNAASDSPTLGDGFTTNNASNVGMYAAFPQVTLSPGQEIKLSGSVTINGITGTSAGEFRVGLFQENANPPATLGWLGVMANHSSGEDTGTIVSRNPNGTAFATTTSFSNLAGRATTLAVGGNSQYMTSGTYDFQLTIGRYDDGSITTNASIVSDNGYAFQAYRGTESDPQRITYDFNRAGFLMGAALNATQMEFSGIDATVASINAPTVKVSPSGAVAIVNTSSSPIDLKYYEITSASGALNAGGWTSLDSGEGGDPVGMGWDVANGGGTSSLLAEGNLQGATTLAPGATLSLGNAAANNAAHDLRFYYALPGGATYRGLVEYTTPTATAGDFDADGDVDGADFIAWQTHYPTASGATMAGGDANGDGKVDGADFAAWQANFPTASGGAVNAVPEPSAWLLAACGVAGVVGTLFRRRK